MRIKSQISYQLISTYICIFAFWVELFQHHFFQTAIADQLRSNISAINIAPASITSSCVWYFMTELTTANITSPVHDILKAGLWYNIIIVSIKRIFPYFGNEFPLGLSASNLPRVNSGNFFSNLIAYWAHFMKVLHSMCERHHTIGPSEIWTFVLLSWAVHWRVFLGVTVVVLFCFIKFADHNILDKCMNHVWLNCWKANGGWQQIYEHFVNKMFPVLSYFPCKLVFLGRVILFSFKLWWQYRVL